MVWASGTESAKGQVTSVSLEATGQGGFQMPFEAPVTEDFPSLTFLPSSLPNGTSGP